jgi:hypothetical protein
MLSEEQALLKCVIKTPKRNASFLDNWSDSPSVVLHALPFLWQKCRNGKVHHFADMFLANTIVAQQLQFDLASEYVSCHGWTLHKFCGEPSLKYHKLVDVIDSMAPTGRATKLVKKFHAMVDEIYKMLDDDTIKHILLEDLPFNF